MFSRQKQKHEAHTQQAIWCTIEKCRYTRSQSTVDTGVLAELKRCIERGYHLPSVPVQVH